MNWVGVRSIIHWLIATQSLESRVGETGGQRLIVILINIIININIIIIIIITTTRIVIVITRIIFIMIKLTFFINQQLNCHNDIIPLHEKKEQISFSASYGAPPVWNYNCHKNHRVLTDASCSHLTTWTSLSLKLFNEAKNLICSHM